MIDVEKLTARHEKRRQRCLSWYRRNSAKHIANMRDYRRGKREGVFIPKRIRKDPEQMEAIRRILAVRPDYKFDW